MAPPKGKLIYSEGEEILCYHGPLVYKAKVLKTKDNGKYFIHYSGWKTKWDEWVGEDRMLKITDENLRKQKQLVEDIKNAKRKGGPSGASRRVKADPAAPSPTPQTDKEKPDRDKADAGAAVESGSSSATQSSKKSGATRRSTAAAAAAEPEVETLEAFQSKVEVKIRLPEELKPHLVNDWNAVCRMKKVVQLPAKKTVETILSDYLEYKQTNKSAQQGAYRESSVKEMTLGVRDYFDACLGHMLLYRFERAQYDELEEIHNHKKAPSEIYGARHLLRLFVKIGEYLGYTNLNEEELSQLTYQLHDFLRWMARNTHSLFLEEDYMVVSTDFLRRTL